MKICIVHIPLVRPGGATRLMLSMALKLKQTGHDITIYSPLVDPSNCYPHVLKSFKVYEVSLFKKPTPVKFSAQVPNSGPKKSWAYRLFVLMKRLAPKSIVSTVQAYYEFLLYSYIGTQISPDFDLVNGHNFNSEWALFSSKILHRSKTIWMCNEPPLFYYMPDSLGIFEKIATWPLFSLLDKMAVKSIDNVLVLSSSAKEIATKAYGNIKTNVNAPGSEVLDNFLQERVTHKRPACILSKDSFLILYVAAMAPYKRPIDAVKAFAIFSEKVPNACLAMVGDGSEKASVVSFAKEHGLANSVQFLDGTISDAALSCLYARCDLFIAPGEQTWGLAIMEVLSAGKPAIISERAGVLDVLENGKDCITINHGDVNALAVNMLKLYHNPKLRSELGQNGCKKARLLTWDAYAKNVERMIQK